MKETVRIDFYTKAVLTVIAACLVWLCLGGVLRTAPPLQASGQEYVDVRIRGIERDVSEAWDPVDITAGDALPVEVLNQEAVPVEILNELVPVDVKNVAVKTSLVPLEKKDN
jgi:LEA14-like dessication related protein